MVRVGARGETRRCRKSHGKGLRLRRNHPSDCNHSSEQGKRQQTRPLTLPRIRIHLLSPENDLPEDLVPGEEVRSLARNTHAVNGLRLARGLSLDSELTSILVAICVD